ncbi:hypothetical protein CGN74_01395 [Salmonella enterica]|nr:hypothetical protein [Salmonella enterica]EJQ7233854.1 hypothetical protein [Salmonella enterica subsp. enterica]EAX5483515.1 hypothetical protein [Salmonella enterica]EAY0448796.1 hypothetical protein [Salmonella enterica]EAZ7993257.1 hypothetical protein [Salmonella enterica]
MSNWGIGLGAFAQGLNNGMDLGTKIRTAYEDNVQRNEIENAQQEAEQDRDNAAQNLVKVSDQAGPTQPKQKNGGMGSFISNMFDGDSNSQNQMPKTYSYGGKYYSSMDEAKKAAESDLPPVDSYMDKYTDQIKQNIIKRTGNEELAEKWSDFAQQAKSKRMFSTAANAYRKFGAGNYDGGIQDLGDIMKNGDFGVEIVGHKPVTDANGNITGFTVQMRNTDNGKEYDQTMTPDALLEFTKTFATPSQLFSQLYQRQAAADQAKFEMAKQGQKNAWEDRKLDKGQGNKLEQITTEAKVKQKFGDGLSGFKRPTAPVEAVRQSVRDILKQSAGWNGQPTISDDEALKRAIALNAKIYNTTPEKLLQQLSPQ